MLNHLTHLTTTSPLNLNQNLDSTSSCSLYVNVKNAGSHRSEKYFHNMSISSSTSTDALAPAAAKQVSRAQRLALLKSPRGYVYMGLVCFLAFMTYLGGFFMIASGIFELLYEVKTHQSGHVERFLGVFPAPAARGADDPPDMVEWLSTQDWYFGAWTKPRWFILISVGSFKFAHALGLCFADTLGAPFTYHLEQVASVCHMVMLVPIHIGHAAIGDPVVATFVIAGLDLLKILLKPAVHKLEPEVVEDGKGDEIEKAGNEKALDQDCVDGGADPPQTVVGADV